MGVADLSFDDLIPGEQRKQATSPNIKSLSFDDLLPGATNPDANLGGTMQFGPWDTGIKIPAALEAGLVGAGKQLARLGQGVQQPFTRAPAALKAKVDEENRLYQPLADAHPIATAVGEAAPVIAGGPLTMAAMGAAEYGTPEERALRAGLGFAGGKIGEAGGKLIGRAVQPIRGAAVDATQALFDKYGISALPGQITGSAPVQWAESVLSKLPGGGRIRDIQAQQGAGLNRAALDAMGGTGDSFTPEAVNLAKQAVGQTFQQVPQGVAVGVDRKLANDLLGVEQNHYKNLSPDQRSIVKTYIDDILQFGNHGGMPGEVYQKARSRIAARAASTQDSELKTALGGVYRALDGAFDRSAPQAASDAMATARSQWRAAKTLEPLANVDGRLSGARAATAGKSAAPGTPLRDVAELGAKMRSLPDSGTAQRAFYQSLFGGGVGLGTGLATNDPMEGLKYGLGSAASSFVGPWLATQLLTRAPVRNYLTKGIANVSPEMEAALKRIGGSGGGLLGLNYGQ